MRAARPSPSHFPHRHRLGSLGLLALVMALLPLLVACGGVEPTPEIVIVTATYTTKPLVIVITATFTPSARLVESSATPSPPPSAAPVPTWTSSLSKTAVPEPTATLQPTQGAKFQPTLTTKRPLSRTETPVAAPPAESPTATATGTSLPKPTSKPASLQSYVVVYTSWKGPALQDYSLWAMNGDGSGASKILDLASEPAFSADGNRLVFYHWTDGIYIYNLSNENLRQVVGNSESAFASWAPNGNRLAYWNLMGQDRIHIVNADGSDDRQLTPGLRPSWSLNGGFIAYDSCENNRCGIFRINPDGGGKRQLTNDAGGGAAVSPDGSRIAYWSQADGDFEVYVINADGSGRRQLTKNSGNDALPAWSPDGRYLYYLSDQNGKAWAVMVMNADGTNPRKVAGVGVSPDPARGWQYQRMTVAWKR